jgi:hypothetical protein
MGIAADLTVQDESGTLGTRIVEAARLAVAVHLFESLAASTDNYGRRFAIGGAGPRHAPATADRVHPRRPFRIPAGADDAGAEPGAGPS